MEVPIISREDLKKMIDSGEAYILIDVREPYELEKYGSIPTSHNIPLDELSQALELPEEEFERQYGFGINKEVKIIFYCRSGARADQAATIAKSKGYNAINYLGSALDWADIDENVKKY